MLRFPLPPLALIAALASPALAAEPGQPPLTERTAETGLPLTPEQQSVDFTHADLSWRIDPETQSITGDATLTLKVEKPIRTIQFDLDRNLPVSAIDVDGKPRPASAWNNPEGQLTIRLPRNYRAGEELKLRIRYAGTPHVAVRAPWDGGFVWSETPGGAPWIATAVQGEGCDLFWPCFDSSEIEIDTVDLHITVPQGLAAPSNGRFIGKQDNADGTVTWNWRAQHPNNYAIALNIAPYESIGADYRSRFGNVIPMTYWFLPGEEAQAKELFSEFAPTLDFFESTIGPYPFGDEKMGVVETPHLGMEHQTINAYGNGYKKSAEGYDWLFHHEFSHEWFGNQLTNENWDDMWLHEGLGSYMQPLYLRWRGGEMPYMAALAKQRAQIKNRFPLVSGQPRTEDQVYNDADGPGLDIYVKGSWVAHSLRELIGDEAFFRTLRREVYGRPDPAPGNFEPRFGSSTEFQRIASEEAGRDLGWFFDIYLRRAELPKLVTSRNGTTLELVWQTPDDLPFPMPVEIWADGTPLTVDMEDNRGSVELPSPDAHVVLDPHAKILRQSDDIDAFHAWQAAQVAE
ncbi:M1 family metallopeptidase [Novosphingopyxis iocasae]|uniref:M1 family metallopeptidase n=1 Tax=Novosphingopyxis iocasae TaxID=2762729 RepID=UPI001650E682|nr:M1 family metallopeptidase [Novosphingopyxis iocasae]